MKILFVILAALMLVIPSVIYGSQGSMNDDPIYRFAADISKRDATLLKQVSGFIEAPPTTLETIGFYGAENEAPRTRAFLGTVSALSDASYLRSVEDKYLNEIFQVWNDEKIVDVSALPSEGKAIFEPMINGSAWDPEIEGVSADYLAELDAKFGIATRQIEDQLAAKNQVLLSVDPTDGDTLFFAIVSPEIAARWRDKKFAEMNDGFASSVRAPIWSRAWDNLIYAFDLPTIGDTYTRPLPPQTRGRAENLPMVE